MYRMERVRYDPVPNNNKENRSLLLFPSLKFQWVVCYIESHNSERNSIGNEIVIIRKY